MDITDSVGKEFIHDPGMDGSYYFPESMGSGCAFFDYVNDGYQDIYLINGHIHNGNQKFDEVSKIEL